MYSMLSFLFFIPILSIILIGINVIFAIHAPNKEKKTPFECGYHSFLGQARTQFGIVFFVYGIAFIVFDLEVVSLYPLAVSIYDNAIYGTTMAVLFAIIVTVGFVFELGKGALKLESRQTKEASFSTESKYNPHPFETITSSSINETTADSPLKYLSAKKS